MFRGFQVPAAGYYLCSGTFFTLPLITIFRHFLKSLTRALLLIDIFSKPSAENSSPESCYLLASTQFLPEIRSGYSQKSAPCNPERQSPTHLKSDVASPRDPPQNIVIRPFLRNIVTNDPKPLRSSPGNSFGDPENMLRGLP